jgi:hypothetical protein
MGNALIRVAQFVLFLICLLVCLLAFLVGVWGIITNNDNFTPFGWAVIGLGALVIAALLGALRRRPTK